MRLLLCFAALCLASLIAFTQYNPAPASNGGKAVLSPDQPDVQHERVSIHDVQYTTDPSGQSPYYGKTVRVRGVVTAVFVDGYVLADAGGPWNAVFVYTKNSGPHVGDKVEITGLVDEYNGMTEMKDITAYSLIASGKTVDPVVVTVSQASQEMYESVLITVQNVTVTSLQTYGEWIVSNNGTLRCDDLNDYMYFPKVGDTLSSLTGILFYRYGSFSLEPRDTSDIPDDMLPHYALLGDVVTMNDTLDVLDDTYVEILGDRIVNITATPPRDLDIVDTAGLIFPGLIDSHNHLAYNVLDHIPFGQTYPDRYHWQADPMYTDFKQQLSSIEDYGGANAQVHNIYKLAEVRALCAGTTMVQSGNCNGDSSAYYAHEGMVTNNIERYPSRVYDSVFPLSSSQAYWKGMQAQYWDRFIIHLSEGTNAAAIQEFNTWLSWGMMDYRTTIIHGVPLGTREWQIMAENDASLIWSPISNWVLYGSTADAAGALAAGVNVAIAPDWTPSGGRNVLEEMKFGNDLNQQLWGGVIQPVDFACMVTRNAALATGAQDRIGRIAPGFQADLMVLPSNAYPYQALLDALSTDVKLTVVSGRPMYGDADLMQQFPFLDTLETVSLSGHSKTLATQIDAHSIPYSDEPFQTVVTELKSAYTASSPKICDLLCEFD